MPLRLRVVLLIGFVLLASMAAGALIAGFQVRRALAAELAAGLAGARQTATSAFEDLPRSDHPARDLRQLVATFDGNRHVRASLLGGDGRVACSSHNLASAPATPGWFRRLVEVRPAPLRLRVPPTPAGPAVLVLTPVPDLDVGAVWAEFAPLIGVLAATGAAGLAMVYLVLGAAFRPLTAMAGLFRQIGAGDYSGRVAAAGPPELVHLQRGFNLMAQELEATTRRNRLLTEQLATLQEEERADIARDLHDEIGPHLFAVNVDAEMIARCLDGGQLVDIRPRIDEIQGAVRYMQGHVRDLLRRLRPTQLTEFGLAAAIGDLVRFWERRQPQIAFALTLTEEEIPPVTAEIVYRIVQEGVSNAVRHGQPATIAIAVIARDDALAVSVSDDGAGGADPGAAAGSGLGLIGMRERVEASGGTLGFGREGAGWRVAARLPLRIARSGEGRAVRSDEGRAVRSDEARAVRTGEARAARSGEARAARSGEEAAR